MFYRGYIVNPDRYLLPEYKLSSFSNEDIWKNREMPQASSCDEYFDRRHGIDSYYYTANGRDALNTALVNLCLNSDDIVTILTTTQNFYISSCVTTEVEKFCKWDRVITEKTKVILVNHEFGFPYEGLKKLKDLNIPIIEDCAYSFNSQNAENSVGKVGDFVIYSFPKFFPVQVGGMLVSNRNVKITREIDIGLKIYLRNALSFYVPFVNEFSVARKNNYNFLKAEIEKIGLKSRFEELNGNVTPGVFMFELPEKVNLKNLKQFYYNNGVECSVFYGENTFFLPCHHKLLGADLDFFVALLTFYINDNNLSL